MAGEFRRSADLKGEVIMNNFGDKVSFIWSVADLLRGPYKPFNNFDSQHTSD